MTPTERVLAAREGQQANMTPTERVLASRQTQPEAAYPTSREEIMKMPAGPKRSQVLQQIKKKEGNWYDAPRAVLEGATFGFADEIGSGVSAALTAPFDDRGVGEIYDDNQRNARNASRNFRDENPLSTLGLNVAGGIASGTGAYKALGALGKAGATAVNSTRAGSALAQTAGKVAGATPRLSRALAAGTKLGAVGAIDGGLSGAGLAEDMASVPEGVKRGATTGALASVALGSAGKVLGGLGRTLTKRRVAQPLDQADGSFLDLNYAAKESPDLQNFYQKMVAPSFGGGALRDRGRTRLAKATEALQRKSKVIEDTQIDAVRLNTKVDDAKMLKNAKVSELDIAKANQADVPLVDYIAADTKLRTQIRDLAIPSGTPPQLAEMIKRSDGATANDLIQEAWQGYGFQSVKNAKVNVNLDELTNKILTKYGANLDKAGVDKVRGLLKSEFDNVRMPQSPNGLMNRQTGEVSGSVLMDARNALRVRANEMSDGGKSSLEAYVLKDASKEIDDYMLQKLPPNIADAFDADKAAYAARETFRGATEKAGRTGGGFANTDQLLAERISSQGREVGRGNDALANSAQQVQKEKAGMLGKAVAARKAAEAEVKKSDAGIADARRIADVNKATLPLAQRAKAREQEAFNEVKKLTPNLSPAAFEKFFATGAMGSWVSAVLGQTFNASSLLSGGATAKIAGSKGVQRAIAGQTNKQEVARELFKQLGEAGVPDKTISALNRAIVMNSAEDEK